MKKYIIISFVIAAIVAMMILNNCKSILVRELPGPRAGVNSLYTVDGKLIAVSRDNDVYSWDWTDMSSWPQAGKIAAKKKTAPTGCKQVLEGDINGDCKVNMRDLAKMSSEWLTDGTQ